MGTAESRTKDERIGRTAALNKNRETDHARNEYEITEDIRRVTGPRCEANVGRTMVSRPTGIKRTEV